MSRSIRHSTRAALIGITVASAIGIAAAQELEPAQIDVTELGPQVGELVPEFSLPDQNGEIWTRDSILGPNGAMLVFIRSADW